ncbi:hypothetical protein ACF08M_13310 [Streptomyces sp. NPDC015032]|uniref:hypothetical protein n=1 Tax=Streptomyces sp. NPDC015032 TaxID=3364937 RepID=UPI0036F7EAB7
MSHGKPKADYRGPDTERHTWIAFSNDRKAGRIFKTWREEYRANQAVKRQIELEQWEQDKRWREEDRAARQGLRQRHHGDLLTPDITATTSAIDKIIVQDLAWVVSTLLQLLELRRGIPAEGHMAALPA